LPFQTAESSVTGGSGLRAAHVTDPERYIAYSNSAHDLTEETVRESRAALERLISRLQAQP
jgi:hypothetical protein